jgi:hypothetical protein
LVHFKNAPFHRSYCPQHVCVTRGRLSPRHQPRRRCNSLPRFGLGTSRQARGAQLLAEERADLADQLLSAKDQQSVDRDQWNNDRADGGSTDVLLRLDAANLKRDTTDIAALKKAVTGASQDRAYLAHCGNKILVKGVRREVKHFAQLTVALDRGALAVEIAELAYDQRELGDAMAVGDKSLEHEYQSIIDSDKSLIRALRGQISKLQKQIAKL